MYSNYSNGTTAADAELLAAEAAAEAEARARAFEDYLSHGEHTLLAQVSRLVPVALVPLLVLLGTFGNLLTLLVLLRPLNLLPRLRLPGGSRARPTKQQVGPSRARLSSNAASAAGGKQASVASTVFYLCTLSLLDLAYLYVGPALYWLFVAYDINAIGLCELSCRLVPFLSNMLSNMANWVIVLLTGDRLVWVLLPFKAKGFCTLRNAAVALGGVSLSLLALYAVMPLAYSLSRTENARGTFTLCYLSPGLKKALSWIDLFSFSLLPFLIIFACNITIIYKLNQYRRIRANMNKCGYKKAHSDCSPAVSSAPAPAIVVTPQNPSADSRYSRASFQRAVSKSSSLSPVTAVACGVSESDAFVTLECTQCSSGCPGTAKAAARKSVSATRSLHIALGPTRSASVREQPAPGSGVGGRAQMNSSRERTLTLMLLTVSIFFIVTTLPITTLNLVYLVLSPNFEDPENTTIAGYYDLMQTIAQVLCYTNNSLYFWLYCMSGSYFRRQVRLVFESLCAPLLTPCGHLCARLCGQRDGRWCRLSCVNCDAERRGSDSGESLRAGEGATVVDRLTTPTRLTPASDNMCRRDADADDDADGLRFTAPPVHNPPLNPPAEPH